MSTQIVEPKKKRTTNAAVTSYRVACGDLGFMKKGVDFVPTPPKQTEGYQHVYRMQKHLEKESWILTCNATGADVTLKDQRIELEAQLKSIKDKIQIPTRAQVALLRTWEKGGVPSHLQLFNVGQKTEIRRKSAIESKPIIDARRLLRKKNKAEKKAKDKAKEEEKNRIRQEKLDARRAKIKAKREVDRAAKIASGEIKAKKTKTVKKTKTGKTKTGKTKTGKTKKIKSKKTKGKKFKKSRGNAMEIEGQVAICV